MNIKLLLRCNSFRAVGRHVMNGCYENHSKFDTKILVARCFSNNNTDNDKARRPAENSLTSKGTQKNTVPDNFFDQDTENENMFLDIASATVLNGGLENIATTKKINWDYLMPEHESLVLDGEIKNDVENQASKYADRRIVDNGKAEVPQQVIGQMMGIDDSLRERIDDLSDMGIILDPGDLNYNKYVRTEEDFPDPLLEKFIPDTAPEKYRADFQADRTCPGRLQRHGKTDSLRCHKIDLDDVSPFNLKLLEKYLTIDSEILGKKRTGLCSKCQRKVAKTIKHSRNLGLLPHLGELQRLDADPFTNDSEFHKTIGNNTKIESRTILK